MRSTEMIPHVALLASVLLVLCSCRTPYTHSPVDLAEAMMPPTHPTMVIDGKRSSPEEWTGSVCVPFGNTGKAEFLWNRTGIFALFSEIEEPPFDPELLCFSISDSVNSQDARSARFDIRGIGSHVANNAERVAILEIVKDSRWDEPLLPPFDESLVQFAAVSGLWKQGSYWSAELFMAWDFIEARNGPRGTVVAHVYRVVIERPLSSLKMERPLDAQPGASPDAAAPRR